jgi:hypothetical protein
LSCPTRTRLATQDSVTHRRVNDRRQAGRRQIDQDQVGLLARPQRANLITQSDGLSALDRGHPQHLPGGHDRRIAGFEFIEKRCKFHLIKDIITIIAAGLIGTQRCQTPGCPESAGRGHDAVNDADAAGAEDHPCATPADHGRFVVGGPGQVDGQQVLVQVANFVQVGGRPLALTFEHLIDLAVAPGDVHVDHETLAVSDLFYPEELVAGYCAGGPGERT